MKNTFIFIFSFLAFYTCRDSTELKDEISGRELLLKKINLLKQKGYKFGHQDDTFYGLNWEWELDRSDI